ncbi:MAG TPA: metalloregulator ArsR/SmtB family transcription factor [Gemmatimonadales bacterium]
MTTASTTDLDRRAQQFRALADPTRLEIVRHLQQGEHCVCELMDHVGAQQSRLSFHLKTLRSAGLVTDRKEGRWVYYRLDPRALAELAAFAAGAAAAETGRFCCR